MILLSPMCQKERTDRHLQHYQNFSIETGCLSIRDSSGSVSIRIDKVMYRIISFSFGK